MANRLRLLKLQMIILHLNSDNHNLQVLCEKSYRNNNNIPERFEAEKKIQIFIHRTVHFWQLIFIQC